MPSHTSDRVERSVDGWSSYAAGPSAAALIEQTIGGSLAHMAATHADALALVSRQQGTRHTYRDLFADVERAARAFLALGLGPGDRIAIWSTNCAEWVIAQCASATIGAILVGINPMFRRRELEFVLDDAGAALLIVASGHLGTEYAAILRTLAPGLMNDGVRAGTDGLPHLRTVVHLGDSASGVGLTWAALMARHQEVPYDHLKAVQQAVRPQDPAAIIYTSGTTGNPKGAMVTHRAQLNCGFVIGERMRYGPRDRICLPVPFYHAFGSVVGTMAALKHGSAIVIPSETFEPLNCLRAIQDEGCTAIYGVPTMFSALLDHKALPEYRMDSMRTGIVAGASCPVGLMQRIIDRLHVPEMTVSFGMTETLATLHTALDDPIERRASSVGVPLPHVECKVVDGTSHEIVPHGTIGELYTRGYGTMLGYWNDPATTAAVLDADGWMHTGDLATMDADGAVAIVGRLKDVIIRAGEKVYPGEIESFLSTHPQVREVHVVGVSDAAYGEDLCAWIRLREGEQVTAEAIRRFCRGAIAGFKIPRHIRFVDAFPTTVTGKIQKFRMREISAAELGADPAAVSAPIPVPLSSASVDPALLEDATLSPLIRYADRAPAPRTARVALLTGATGFVGAHMLSDLLLRTPLRAVCVVRADHPAHALSRLRDALSAQRVWRPEFESRIDVVAADLSKPALGLPEAEFAALGAEVDVIYHVGAQLNLVTPYRVLAASNVRGTHEMLRLAAFGNPKAFHHVSSLAVFGPRQFDPAQPLEEEFDITTPPPETSGYATSKWGAEQLVSEAARRGLAVSVYRPGLVTGHSETGICNPQDALSLVLAGCIQLGVAPVFDAVIHLTPVDIVSRAVVNLSQRAETRDAFHLLSPTAVTWQEVADVLHALGYVKDRVPLDEWRRLVSRESAGERHAGFDRLYALLSRPKPPFSPAKRNVSDARVRSGLTDHAYPADHVTLIGRYASHLASVSGATAQSARAAGT